MGEKLFDLSEKYEAMLERGLRLSGEDSYYFVRERLRDLRTQLPFDWTPRRILDFGCGIGQTAQELATLFPQAEVLGLDSSEMALARARRDYPDARVAFGPIENLPKREVFDLCYVNGVFHHIAPSQWLGTLQQLCQALVGGGYLALFENNPWNPGARLVMRRIPFDRNATLLSTRTSRRLVMAAGFSRITSTRTLFYFPRILASLRFMEPLLSRFPLGAQYYVLAQK